MIDLSCHCGAVRLKLAKRPDYINECNCTLCRKAGAWWGYFDPSDVRVEGETTDYRRTDKAEPGTEVRFCAKCGATTHFVLTEAAIAKYGDTLRGVNMRLAEEAELAGVEVRYPDGAAWPGEGDFGYVREAIVLGD